MNRLLSILSISILLIISCQADRKDEVINTQTESIDSKNNIEVKSDVAKHLSKTDSLIFFYQKITSDNYTLKDLKEFQYIFPSDFLTFKELFGYDKSLGAKPLYHEAESYIDVFFSDLDEATYRKVFDIAKTGSWEADAVNYFNRKITSLLTDKDTQFLDVISNASYTSQVSFWKYHFDSPHPIENLPAYITELPKFKYLNKAIHEAFNNH